jgi:hypothetical protein
MGRISPETSGSEHNGLSGQAGGPDRDERVGFMAVIELAIGPGSMPGSFRVEVIDSPAGHLSALAGLDVESLAARRGLLQQEVLASSVRARGIPETEQLLREAGQALFAGLLGAGGVAGCYRASAAVAAERGEELRVVLRIDDPALAGLPWEAMFDAELGTYVCRRDQLVRHVPVASASAPLQVRPPLRILGVASSPRGLPRLDAGKEKDHLARALARPASQGLAEVHWAPDSTWAGLQDMLMDGEWHVLHYIGHGDFDPGQDEGVLALERDDGFADMVSARRLVDLLRQARPMPRLVVLNSCAGAVTSAGDLFSGTAAALVRGGIPAVAAMQYKISDDAAIAFARGFYAAIARGRDVDDAVSSGRVAILGTSDHTLEWVTPVLYLRGHQARLFAPVPAVTTRADSPTQLSAGTSPEAPTDLPPLLPPQTVAGTWTVVVAVDSASYYSERARRNQAFNNEDATFGPLRAHVPERRFRLSGTEVRIGRLQDPRASDINLIDPVDPGMSTVHAVLIAGPDRSWSVAHPPVPSTNGIKVNGERIQQGQAVSLRDGDRIDLGLWTVITVTRD